MTTPNNIPRGPLISFLCVQCDALTTWDWLFKGVQKQKATSGHQVEAGSQERQDHGDGQD